ncbi:MAG: heavy metal translocating P-type ATPase [Verrucomicrobiota bacterium]
MSASDRSVPERDPARCLARSVAAAFSEEPGLEAVTVDLNRKSITVATIGRNADSGLNDRIAGRVREAQGAIAEESCCLVRADGDCASCALPLTPSEHTRIRIERSGNSTTIARVTCPTAPKFWRWRDVPWPKVMPREVEFLEGPEHVDEWKPQLAMAVLCGIFAAAGYLLPAPWSVSAWIVAYVAGGWFPTEEVWERLQKRTVDVHFLMLAVAAGSAGIGAWGEGAILLFLFSFSGALEHYALGRTQREIHSLFKDAPQSAVVLDDSGREQQLPVAQLRPGMRLILKPGAQAAVDGEVVKGRTAMDESNLTGEATPVEKTVGDQVLAGTLNLWGAVEVTVLRPATESALQKIVHLIQEAQKHKAPAQQFTDKFSTGYTYFALGLSALMLLVWWQGFGLPLVGTGDGRASAFYRTMTLLVVASPCALVLSIPSSVLAAIAWGARHGILFRGGAAVEKLATTKIVALDKTGTLTTGDLRVERVESFPPGREREVARLAYALEKLSTHPFARAITRHGRSNQLPPGEVEQFESVTGHGLRARCEGETCLLGKREWVAEQAPAAPLARIPPADPGVSEICVVHSQLIGRILLRDDVRPQARAVLQSLHNEGLRAVVLTGDRRAAADHLKALLGLDDVRAELKPEDKVAAIRSLSSQGHHVAMIGDGVNDAPSLAAAHIGVAMGARGSDAALEQADVVLMHDRLENFLAAFRLSQRASCIIRQNLVISLGTVLVLVGFALAGGIPLTLGVVGHEGSTVVVVMNSLRLLFGPKGRFPAAG